MDQDGISEHEEFGKLLSHIRRRVAATLSSCKSLPSGIAESAAAGSYILQYWINRDDASVRTCHFETRFYVPVASGSSFEMHYRFHFRSRMYTEAEHFVELYTCERSIECCDAVKPTPIREWKPCQCDSRAANADMIKLLSQSGAGKAAVHARKGVIQELATGILSTSTPIMPAITVFQGPVIHLIYYLKFSNEFSNQALQSSYL